MNLNEKKKLTKNLALLYLVAIGLMITISLIMGSLSDKDFDLPTSISLIVSEAFFLVPSTIYICANKLSLADLGLKKLNVKSILLSIALGITVIPISSFINILTQFFVKNTMAQASSSLLGGSSLVVILLVGVYGPLCEEIMFRCILNRQYNRIFSVLTSALISAMLFGLAHMNFNQICYAFVLGLLFSFANCASGSVITSMIMHMVVNILNTGLMIVSNKIMEAAGSNIADVAEATRQSDIMLTAANTYFMLALIFGGISFLLMRRMAKIEDRSEIFANLFKKNSDQEITQEEKPAKLIFNIPMILAILCVLAYTIYWQINA